MARQRRPCMGCEQPTTAFGGLCPTCREHENLLQRNNTRQGFISERGRDAFIGWSRENPLSMWEISEATDQGQLPRLIDEYREVAYRGGYAAGVAAAAEIERAVDADS